MLLDKSTPPKSARVKVGALDHEANREKELPIYVAAATTTLTKAKTTTTRRATTTSSRAKRAGMMISSSSSSSSSSGQRQMVWATKIWATLLVLVVILSQVQSRTCLLIQDQASPLQQLQQQIQQQQPNSIGGGGQAAPLLSAVGGDSSSGGGNSGYSALINGADNLLGGLNLGQPYYSSNSKRARKMSAFMPMRGRRTDGRTQAALDSLMAREQQQQQQQQEQATATMLQQFAVTVPSAASFRESDGDASILRLVSSGGSGGNQQTGSGNWLSSQAAGTPSARQFANQFVARHLQLGGGGGETLNSMNEGSGDDSSSIVQAIAPASMRMQAKLRRAFHPMRGKKSDSSFSTNPNSNNEFAYQIDPIELDS